MPELTVTVINAGARVEHSVTTGTCAWELFRDDPAVIAARVGERQLDLSYELKDGDELEGIATGSEDGRAILRHSRRT